MEILLISRKNHIPTYEAKTRKKHHGLFHERILILTLLKVFAAKIDK